MTDPAVDPWWFSQDEDNRFVVGCGDHEIALVGGMPHANPDRDARADARLIAAAPELLAALRACEQQLAHYAAGVTALPGGSAKLNHAAVRAAIARAEGALDGHDRAGTRLLHGGDALMASYDMDDAAVEKMAVELLASHYKTQHPHMHALMDRAADLLRMARDVLDDEPGTPGGDFATSVEGWLRDAGKEIGK